MGRSPSFMLPQIKLLTVFSVIRLRLQYVIAAAFLVIDYYLAFSLSNVT
jgi:hypothetical protein